MKRKKKLLLRAVGNLSRAIASRHCDAIVPHRFGLSSHPFVTVVSRRERFFWTLTRIGSMQTDAEARASFRVVKNSLPRFCHCLPSHKSCYASATASQGDALDNATSSRGFNYLVERAISHCRTASRFVSSLALMP
jgi:hypothetical protein